MAERAARWRRLRLALAMAAIVFTSMGMACEVALRALGLGVELFDNADPILGHRFKRNLDVEVLERGRHIRYRTNSLGFRGPEPDDPKRRTRIVLLGDSFAAGQDWHEDDTFPRLVEKELGAEVVNLGVPAYDPATELVALERIALPLLPDAVVVVLFTGNDISPSSHSTFSSSRPAFTVDDGGALRFNPFTPRGVRPFASLLAHSALYTWQKHEVRRVTARLRARVQGGDPWHAIYTNPTTPQWEAAWRLHELLLIRMRELCDAKGVPLLFVIVPDVVQVEDSEWTRLVASSPNLGRLERELPQTRHAAIAERGNLRMLDLLPVLRAAGNAPSREPLYDGHLVHRGHRVVADALVPRLRTMVPSPTQ